MSAFVFTLRDQPAQRLDLAPLAPLRLKGLSKAEIAAIALNTTRERVTVGDVFSLRSGDAAQIQFEGGSERFDRVGVEMTDGDITVNGPVGTQAGRRMTGGRLTIAGDAGPWTGSGMRGGVLENIHVRNIAVGQVAHAVITIDFNYEEGGKGDYKPVLRNLTVEKLVSGKSRYAVDLQGLPNAELENITLRDYVFNNVAEPSIVKYVDGIRLENVTINGKPVTRLM